MCARKRDNNECDPRISNHRKIYIFIDLVSCMYWNLTLIGVPKYILLFYFRLIFIIMFARRKVLFYENAYTNK